MVDIEQVRGQAQAARQLVEQKKAEAQDVERQLQEQERALPQVNSQQALRSKFEGLQGRNARRQVETIRSDIGQRRSSLGEYNQELQRFESDVATAESEITEYDLNRAALEKARRLLEDGKGEAYLQYGSDDRVKRYLEAPVEQAQLDRDFGYKLDSSVQAYNSGQDFETAFKGMNTAYLIKKGFLKFDQAGVPEARQAAVEQANLVLSNDPAFQVADISKGMSRADRVQINAPLQGRSNQMFPLVSAQSLNSAQVLEVDGSSIQSRIPNRLSNGSINKLQPGDSPSSFLSRLRLGTAEGYKEAKSPQGSQINPLTGRPYDVVSAAPGLKQQFLTTINPIKGKDKFADVLAFPARSIGFIGQKASGAATRAEFASAYPNQPYAVGNLANLGAQATLYAVPGLGEVAAIGGGTSEVIRSDATLKERGLGVGTAALGGLGAAGRLNIRKLTVQTGLTKKELAALQSGDINPTTTPNEYYALRLKSQNYIQRRYGELGNPNAVATLDRIAPPLQSINIPASRFRDLNPGVRVPDSLIKKGRIGITPATAQQMSRTVRNQNFFAQNFPGQFVQVSPFNIAGRGTETKIIRDARILTGEALKRSGAIRQNKKVKNLVEDATVGTRTSQFIAPNSQKQIVDDLVGGKYTAADDGFLSTLGLARTESGAVTRIRSPEVLPDVGSFGTGFKTREVLVGASKKSGDKFVELSSSFEVSPFTGKLVNRRVAVSIGNKKGTNIFLLKPATGRPKVQRLNVAGMPGFPVVSTYKPAFRLDEFQQARVSNMQSAAIKENVVSRQYTVDFFRPLQDKSTKGLSLLDVNQLIRGGLKRGANTKLVRPSMRVGRENTQDIISFGEQFGQIDVTGRKGRLGPEVLFRADVKKPFSSVARVNPVKFEDIIGAAPAKKSPFTPNIQKVRVQRDGDILQQLYGQQQVTQKPKPVADVLGNLINPTIRPRAGRSQRPIRIPTPSSQSPRSDYFGLGTYERTEGGLLPTQGAVGGFFGISQSQSVNAKVNSGFVSALDIGVNQNQNQNKNVQTQDLGLNVNQKQDSILNLNMNQKQGQNLLQRQNQNQTQGINQNQKINQNFNNILQMGTGQRPAARNVLGQRTRTQQRARVTRTPGSTLPKPKTVFKTKGGSVVKIDEGRYVVFVKRFGQDSIIGEAATVEGAKRILRNSLTSSLGASGFVSQSATGKRVNVNLGFGFRPGKRDRTRVVQEDWFRLGSQSERSEIQRARRQAPARPKRSRSNPKVDWFGKPKKSGGLKWF